MFEVTRQFEGARRPKLRKGFNGQRRSCVLRARCREFGQTIMTTAAHASDSVEKARLENGIVNVAENTFRRVVEEFYGK